MHKIWRHRDIILVSLLFFGLFSVSWFATNRGNQAKYQNMVDIIIEDQEFLTENLHQSPKKVRDSVLTFYADIEVLDFEQIKSKYQIVTAKQEEDFLLALEVTVNLVNIHNRLENLLERD